MKLQERHGRKNPHLKTVELLTTAQENDGRFDPQIHIPEYAWMLGSPLQIPTNRLASLWEAQLYLNPKKLEQLHKETSILIPANQFSHAHFIQEAKKESDFLKRLELSLAVRDLFPEAKTDEHFSEDVQRLIPRLKQIRQVTGNAGGEAVKSLYLVKRSPALSSENLALQPNEWKKIRKWWDEVWGAGQLEDVAPDTLVELMAKVRVVDPERFKEITLDQKFWDLALGWLKTLREEKHTTDAFIFAFYLHLLAADSVEVDSDGKLRIQSRSSGVLKKPTPLPERNIVA